VVLYHRDTGSGVVLNPTGSIIWDSLATPSTAGELAASLSARYPAAEPGRVDADVAGYVKSLLENGLVSSED
jgi:hypothetical protein